MDNIENIENGCNDKNNSLEIFSKNIDIESEIEKYSNTLSINEQPKEIIIGKDITVEKVTEIFPKTDESINRVRITDVGLYSITKKNEAFFITNLITKYFGESQIVITDSTACCGGNTISFLLHPQIEKVNSIEINDLHFEILKNNIELYKNHSKVELIKSNYLDVAHNLEQDVIFYDLPWGGKNYIEKEEITLGLYTNNSFFISLSSIVNQMKEKTKLQVLKIPLNFGFTKFLREIEYTKIKIHKIYNKYTKRLCYFILILVF
jgi:hypothetical protein